MKASKADDKNPTGKAKTYSAAVSSITPEERAKKRAGQAIIRVEVFDSNGAQVQIGQIGRAHV